MGLEVADELGGSRDDLDNELRLAAEAIGAGVVPRLVELRPKVSPAEAAPHRLEVLDLDGEGGPDAVMLAACLAAHAAYVNRRSQAEGVSVGALALARLLVWAQRAAIIGRPLELRWIGPPARAPDDLTGVHPVRASCRVRAGESTARAEAVALVATLGAE